MIILWQFEDCPYSKKVREKLTELNLDFVCINAAKDSKAKKDFLEDCCGKGQVPFIMDTEKHVKMYESDGIVQFLEDNYGFNSNKMDYGYRKIIEMEDFNEAVEKVRDELKKEGFGILTEIDVKKTMKEKLDLDYDDYVILGACNPPFADKALQAEKEIGLLLPCNVIVYKNSGKIIVSAILPSVGMGMIGNSSLKEISLQVEEKLKKVIDSL